jgi:DNA primase
MLPVRDQAGRVAGFVGRASPGAGPQVPRYLNSPETSLYKKGGLLLGLHEGRSALTAGATPVIVEGPFDAIAVTLAGTGRAVGLAPCGTALTTGQAALLATACDLSRAGVVVAFDDDPAGRRAATRAYAILRPHAAGVRLAGLPSGRDPAQVLQEDGPQALLDALTARARPLLGVIVDADVRRWEGRLGDVEGPVRAMRSAAAVLAGLLPPSSAAKVRQAAGGTVLTTVDEDMRPVTHPQVPAITQVLPADTASQALRLATRLGLPVTDVIIEVANAVTRQAAKAPARRQPAATLAAGSFPAGPADVPGEGAPVRAQGAPRPSRRRGPSHRS